MTNERNYCTKFLSVCDTIMYVNPLFLSMAATTENSPWHRESNVLVHTVMVVEEYVRLVTSEKTPDEWNIYDYFGGLCCLFHDVGKPAAKAPKYSESRGDYFAFHGHEILSAREFENFAILNKPLLGLDEQDIFIVSWMIEHHMPWAITDKHKLAELKATCNHYHPTNLLPIFTRALLADQYGRIADDQPAKNVAAEEWVRVLHETEYTVTPNLAYILNDTSKLMFVPIGASGSGKSTFFNEYIKPMPGRTFQKFSLDDLRHEFYNQTDYADAYAQSAEDNTFAAKANERFMSFVKQGVDLYIDNTNLSKKRRAFYVSEAKKRGYIVTAVYFINPIDTLISRQTTRTDKNVPVDSVRRQYMSVQTPSIGEFASIIVR